MPRLKDHDIPTTNPLTECVFAPETVQTPLVYTAIERLTGIVAPLVIKK